MKKLGTLFIVVLILITSCKSNKISDTKISNLSAKKVIKKHYDTGFDKKTIKANLNLKFKGKVGIPNLNASLRMIKDSVIWLSVTKFGIPFAKIMIDQHEVKYYEKISKTYFIGNFDLISRWIGVDLDFNQIQNLLIGEALVDLTEEKYIVNIRNNLYELKPKNNSFQFELSFLIDPYHFKLVEEKIKDPVKKQILSISYKSYQDIDEILFPKAFIIQASDKKNKTIVDINYRSVTFDVKLRFPFKIPNGYKELNINDI